MAPREIQLVNEDNAVGPWHQVNNRPPRLLALARRGLIAGGRRTFITFREPEVLNQRQAAPPDQPLQEREALRFPVFLGTQGHAQPLDPSNFDREPLYRPRHHRSRLGFSFLARPTFRRWLGEFHLRSWLSPRMALTLPTLDTGRPRHQRSLSLGPTPQLPRFPTLSPLISGWRHSANFLQLSGGIFTFEGGLPVANVGYLFGPGHEDTSLMESIGFTLDPMATSSLLGGMLVMLISSPRCSQLTPIMVTFNPPARTTREGGTPSGMSNTSNHVASQDSAQRPNVTSGVLSRFPWVSPRAVGGTSNIFESRGCGPIRRTMASYQIEQWQPSRPHMVWAIFQSPALMRFCSEVLVGLPSNSPQTSTQGHF